MHTPASTDRIEKTILLRAPLARVWRALSDAKGFDRIPLERRAKAFTANEQGWTAQAKLIEKYLASAEKR